MCPGVDSASKNEYLENSWELRLTTYHLLVPNVKKIRGLNLPDPHVPVQACSGTALIFFFAVTDVMYYCSTTAEGLQMLRASDSPLLKALVEQ
jgi:hypothetical protein